MSDNNPKITNTNPISVAKSGLLKNKGTKHGNPAFDRILSEQIKSPGMDSGIGRSSTLPEIQGAFNAQNIDLASLESNPFTKKITDSLDLFERYATFLGDPDKSLKQAYTILEKVLGQAKNLTLEMEQNPGQSSDKTDNLKVILSQLMTTAQVEQIKFDRGDYL